MSAIRPALVVIDLQKGIVERPTVPHTSATVVANAAKLCAHFRAKNWPVFLVRVNFTGGDALSAVSDISVPSGNPPADWAEFVPELDVQPSDHIITKRQWGAFYGTELDLQLRRRGIDTIVLCGIATSRGVESTARDAYERGYNQIFAEDAMASRSVEEHASTIQNIFPRIGRVRSTLQTLELLG